MVVHLVHHGHVCHILLHHHHLLRHLRLVHIPCTHLRHRSRIGLLYGHGRRYLVHRYVGRRGVDLHWLVSVLNPLRSDWGVVVAQMEPVEVHETAKVLLRRSWWRAKQVCLRSCWLLGAKGARGLRRCGERIRVRCLWRRRKWIVGHGLWVRKWIAGPRKRIICYGLRVRKRITGSSKWIIGHWLRVRKGIIPRGCLLRRHE